MYYLFYSSGCEWFSAQGRVWLWKVWHDPDFVRAVGRERRGSSQWRHFWTDITNWQAILLPYSSSTMKIQRSLLKAVTVAKKRLLLNSSLSFFSLFLLSSVLWLRPLFQVQQTGSDSVSSSDDGEWGTIAFATAIPTLSASCDCRGQRSLAFISWNNTLVLKYWCKFFFSWCVSKSFWLTVYMEEHHEAF